MVQTSERPSVDIDELLSSSSGKLHIASPIRQGVKIELKYEEFNGEDILNKTTILVDNERNQHWLNEVSLAPLINAIKEANGQTECAIGIKEEDGTVTIIAGSRRRKASYFAGYPYRVLSSKDILPEEARIFTRVENVKSSISLIEHGERWYHHHAVEGMSFREIALEVEKGDKSHTIIKAGVDGYKLPDSIKSLYPSLNSIGRPTINKLTKAVAKKNAQDIAEFIHAEHADLLAKLASDYAANPEVRCDQLTKIIVEYCEPVKAPLTRRWPDAVSLSKTSDGDITNIEFKKPLEADQAIKLQAFLQSLLNK